MTSTIILKCKKLYSISADTLKFIQVLLQLLSTTIFFKTFLIIISWFHYCKNQYNLQIIGFLCKFDLIISNGHSPQICQNGKLLVRMCRDESHFSQKSPLANVGESGQSRLANVDKCIESGQSRLANVGECIESDQNRLANVGASKIGRFMHK